MQGKGLTEIRDPVSFDIHGSPFLSLCNQLVAFFQSLLFGSCHVYAASSALMIWAWSLGGAGREFCSKLANSEISYYEFPCRIRFLLKTSTTVYRVHVSSLRLFFTTATLLPAAYRPLFASFGRELVGYTTKSESCIFQRSATWSFVHPLHTPRRRPHTSLVCCVLICAARRGSTGTKRGSIYTA